MSELLEKQMLYRGKFKNRNPGVMRSHVKCAIKIEGSRENDYPIYVYSGH